MFEQYTRNSRAAHVVGAAPQYKYSMICAFLWAARPAMRSGHATYRYTNTSCNGLILFPFFFLPPSLFLFSRPFPGSPPSACNPKQAAGLITVAHCSGGPKLDIVVPLKGLLTGYLAQTPEHYAHYMAQVFDEGREGRGAGLIEAYAMPYSVRAAAKISSRRFSNEVFDREFSARFAGLLQPRASWAFSRGRGGKED